MSSDTPPTHGHGGFDTQRGGDTRRFRFRFETSYKRAARLFAVTPSRAWVAVTDTTLEARYGPWRVRTDLSNIRSVKVTGPYRWVRTAGPAHLGLTDRSLTFASNGRRGVEIRFVEPVRGIEPFGLLRHPSLTVTIDDFEGLAAQLQKAIAKVAGPTSNS
jgi:hypothetical protein